MDFYKYLEAFKVHLFMGLENFVEHQVCVVAVGLVGDICRAMNTAILPICDEIMKYLLTNLRVSINVYSLNPHLSRGHWCLLNRFRTDVGPCRSSLHKWGYIASPLCDCGEPQMMPHYS